MSDNCAPYSKGDVVIHRSYGIGKINCIENRPINGVDVECFKVTTENGVYWFPTGNIDNPRIHPVATKEVIQEAINIFQSAPIDQDNDPIQWKDRIDDVQNTGDFLAISRLVRDLSTLKKTKKLNKTQGQALTNLEGRLLKEWSASSKVDTQALRMRLHAYLQGKQVPSTSST